MLGREKEREVRGVEEMAWPHISMDMVNYNIINQKCSYRKLTRYGAYKMCIGNNTEQSECSFLYVQKKKPYINIVVCL